MDQGVASSRAEGGRGGTPDQFAGSFAAVLAGRAYRPRAIALDAMGTANVVVDRAYDRGADP
jgi:hypothetical protein